RSRAREGWEASRVARARRDRHIGDTQVAEDDRERRRETEIARARGRAGVERREVDVDRGRSARGVDRAAVLAIIADHLPGWPDVGARPGRGQRGETEVDRDLVQDDT